MDHEALIRERAYLLWEAAGRPHGRCEEFWHAAVAAIAAIAAEAPPAAPAEAPALQAPARRRAAPAAARPPAGKPASKPGLTSRKVKPAEPAMLPS